MPHTQPWLPQMVEKLCAQVNTLGESRRRGFLDWLENHHPAGGPFSLERLAFQLETWLASLDPRGLARELGLLLEEIAWWRDLPEARLECLLRKDAP